MKCCNQDCRQGRDCPARTQKKDLPVEYWPGHEEEPMFTWVDLVALLAVVAFVTAFGLVIAGVWK